MPWPSSHLPVYAVTRAVGGDRDPRIELPRIDVRRARVERPLRDAERARRGARAEADDERAGRLQEIAARNAGALERVASRRGVIVAPPAA